MNIERRKLLELGLTALPKANYPMTVGRNGEEFATDEAAVWKRVINYRVAAYLQPTIILETHKGYGISSTLYRLASPTATLIDHREPVTGIPHADLIDIDPFGQPWDTISQYRSLLPTCQAILVSNGEAHLVVRNLRKAQRYPTLNFGKRMPIWVFTEYIPRLERMLGLPCRFFYAFPSTIRTIHARAELPQNNFDGCPRWMWWLSKYGGDLKGLTDEETEFE